MLFLSFFQMIIFALYSLKVMYSISIVSWQSLLGHGVLCFYIAVFNLFMFYLGCYPLCQWSTTFLVPRMGFMEDNFSTDWGGGMLSGWLKHIKFIVHFISIIIISAPPQIFRHSVLEVEDRDLCNWEDSLFLALCLPYFM